MQRLTFLSHFVLSLAIAAGAFFAWQSGILLQGCNEPVVRWVGMTIGALFVSGVVWLGWQAWRTDGEWIHGVDAIGEYESPAGDASYGDLLILISPAIGLVGTVSGLSVVFGNLGNQAALATGGSTAFYSARFGIIAMILMAVLVHALETGIKRAQR